MAHYDFKKIEDTWKDKWYSNNLYKAEDFSDKQKKYILVEFPYPSGKSMHVGHMLRYTVPEIYSRFLRMRGYNVLFPMGWDAFGLPAENYAIKTGEHPAKITKELTDYYRKSMQDMGYGIDWDREVNTTDPNYYKWTQWIFLKFWKEGLAEFKEEPVWWSDQMKTVLAEEEVIKDENEDPVAERDGSPVRRRLLKQWVLKIPEYADKLIQGFDNVDFPESIKAAQTNWIGRSEGTVVKFPIEGHKDETLECFTTRIDTIFGVTYIAIAPEHEKLDKLLVNCTNPDEVRDYVAKVKKKTELERQQNKEKTGVLIEGAYVVNPFDTSRQIPVYVADYVLKDYGTGVVMGVPAHDERDYEFAKKFGIDIIPVIAQKKGVIPSIDDDHECFADHGYVVNSGEFDGMTSEDAIEKMTAWLEERGLGKGEITYKIRDWLFTRQRYWGEPIPLIHRIDGKIEPVADPDDPQQVKERLPLKLPELPDYSPSDDGDSPLAKNTEWLNTVADDGTPAKRETNTMPNWAGSCWYYLRYLDPNNDNEIADIEKMKYWLPVDKYFGGSEHTTLHLLYSRFWHKFLYDQGVVPTPEPYQWRLNGGTLLGPDGVRMSKSRGNVVEPQEKLQNYGADAVRMYIAFIGPYEGTFPYNENSLRACSRVLENIYELRTTVSDTVEDQALEKKLHVMIKRVTGMAEELKMNTIVSDIMVFTKDMRSTGAVPKDVWMNFIKVLAPITPFLAEELWQEVNGWKEWEDANSVHLQSWPEYDPAKVVEEQVEVPVQINGKMRGVVLLDVGASEDVVRRVIEEDPRVAAYLEGVEIEKLIYVQDKIVNILTR